MTISSVEAWQDLKSKGFFSPFSEPRPKWSEIIDWVISYLKDGQSTKLLNAFFQVSGVMLPFKIICDPDNEYHNQWLKRIAAADVVAVHCMTEPKGGTDIFSMKSLATEYDTHWLIDGVKTYVCNVSNADVGLLYTNLHGQQSNAPYNLCAFILDMNSKGVSVESPINTIGLKDINLGTIHLDKVKLPKCALLGSAGAAQHIAYISTTLERLLIPIVFVGKLYHFYKQANCQNKAELYRIYTVNRSFLEQSLASIDLDQWRREYIHLGCLVKWQVSEDYIKAAKLTGCEVNYRDSLSSWIYSGTNDALKDMVGRLI